MAADALKEYVRPSAEIGCDVDALVRCMLRFIELPSLIDSMGKKSRQLAEERFDVHKVNARILTALGVTPSA